jgi:hypothetical protein
MPLEMMAQNALLMSQEPMPAQGRYPSTSMYSNQMPMVYFNQGSGGSSASAQYPVAPAYGQPSNAYTNYPQMYVGGRNFGNDEAVAIRQEQVGLIWCICWLHVRTHSHFHVHAIFIHPAKNRQLIRQHFIFACLFCALAYWKPVICIGHTKSRSRKLIWAEHSFF